MPPRNRQWFEVLPEPYNRDQKVLVVMLPMTWRTTLCESKDGKYNFGVMVSPRETILGLQVIDTNLTDYMEHRTVFAKYGVEMADPAFIGKLSELPNDLLNGDRAPLVFTLAAPWRNYVDLKRVWKRSDLKC